MLTENINSYHPLLLNSPFLLLHYVILSRGFPDDLRPRERFQNRPACAQPPTATVMDSLLVFLTCFDFYDITKSPDIRYTAPKQLHPLCDFYLFRFHESPTINPPRGLCFFWPFCISQLPMSFIEFPRCDVLIAFCLIPELLCEQSLFGLVTYWRQPCQYIYPNRYSLIG